MKRIIPLIIAAMLAIPAIASAKPTILKRLTGNWGNPDLGDRVIKIRAKRLKKDKYRLIFVRYVFGKRAKRSVRNAKYGKLIKHKGKTVGFAVSLAVMKRNKRTKRFRIWWKSWKANRVMRASFYKARKGKYKGKYMIRWYRRIKKGKKVVYRYGWRWKKRRNTRIKIGKGLMAKVTALIKSKSKQLDKEQATVDKQAEAEKNVPQVTTLTWNGACYQSQVRANGSVIITKEKAGNVYNVTLSGTLSISSATYGYVRHELPPGLVPVSKDKAAYSCTVQTHATKGDTSKVGVYGGKGVHVRYGTYKTYAGKAVLWFPEKFYNGKFTLKCTWQTASPDAVEEWNKCSGIKVQ